MQQCCRWDPGDAEFLGALFTVQKDAVILRVGWVPQANLQGAGG